MPFFILGTELDENEIIRSDRQQNIEGIQLFARTEGTEILAEF